jgi:ubiquinone/menaquinone biosynthesis C-methylase UbiE
MDVEFQSNIDWPTWIKRWDKMQERYIPARKERFEIIVQLIADSRRKVSKVLDIGCGTGSLMLPILEAFPNTKVWGIDFDTTLLALAKKRLSTFGNRVKLVKADLRKNSWTKLVGGQYDAIVSATALHWFSPTQLSRLYKQFARILKPSGIFLNADHAGSPCKQIQNGWENQRQHIARKYKNNSANDWDGFWLAYGRALKLNVKVFRKKLTGDWVGTEQGLPLEWHFEKLKIAGFVAIDCFWRLDYDAIYGGIRK